MLEAEIQRLTAAITALTEQLKLTPPARIASESAAERSYREDDAAREEMQRKRDEADASAEVEAPKKVSSKKAVKPVTIDHEPVRDPVSEPEKAPATSVAPLTKDDLKKFALEMTRTESSSRQVILDVLAEYGAKTITQLADGDVSKVYEKLMAFAHKMAKEGVPA